MIRYCMVTAWRQLVAAIRYRICRHDRDLDAELEARLVEEARKLRRIMARLDPAAPQLTANVEVSFDGRVEKHMLFPGDVLTYQHPFRISAGDTDQQIVFVFDFVFRGNNCWELCEQPIEVATAGAQKSGVSGNTATLSF